MSAFADIQGAIVSAWQAQGLAYPCAYEGKDFTPPETQWCALSVLPVSVQPAALGNAAPLEHVVLAQVDINYPLNSGTGGLLGDADTVAALFNPGATLTYNGMRLVSERCDRSGIRRDDSWLTISLTAKLRGWQTRA